MTARAANETTRLLILTFFFGKFVRSSDCKNDNKGGKIGSRLKGFLGRIQRKKLRQRIKTSSNNFQAQNEILDSSDISRKTEIPCNGSPGKDSNVAQEKIPEKPVFPCFQ